MSRSVKNSLLTAALLFAMTATACVAQVAGRIEVRDGRPVMLADDHAIVASYCDRFPLKKRMHDRNQRFAAIGTDHFQLMLRGDGEEFYTSGFWTDLNEYNDTDVLNPETYASLDHQAQAILEVNPEAVFTVSFFTAPPIKFAKAQPQEMQTGEDGKRHRAASYASDLWLEGQCEMARRLVRFSEGRPWGDRVIGYNVIPHTEGVTIAGAYGSPFDQAEAMQDAFAKYVRDKYDTDAALREAWGDEEATLEKIAVPTVVEWSADRESWMTFTTPSQTQRYLDYFALQRDLLHRFVQQITTTIDDTATRDTVIAVDAFKQPLQAWMIFDAFDGRGDGMDYFDILLASGSYDVARSLDLPSLNGLMTPADYTARSSGWGLDPEGIGDSMVLRGKAMLFEDDARTWLDKAFNTNQGASRDTADARAKLRRNVAGAYARGYFPYWCNVSTGFYDSDEAMQLIDEIIPLRRKLADTPLTHTEHAIAMIIDDSAGLNTDFTSGFQNLAVLQQRVHELALTGLPYRVYLWSDLERDDFPRFRAYLFPNLIKLTPERIALIREKVLQDGSVAIFGPATGVTDGNQLTAAPASELLGMPMELLDRRAARRVLVYGGAHAALGEVTKPTVYGDSYQYGPVLQPAYEQPDDVTELGKASVYYFNGNTGGLLLRETDDAKIVFSMAMPIPAEVLRSLAIYGGCNPWSDLGDVVYASGEFLSVHSIRPGPRTIHLPGRYIVTDLASDKVVAEGVDHFEITMSSPQTRLFTLEPVVGSDQ